MSCKVADAPDFLIVSIIARKGYRFSLKRHRRTKPGKFHLEFYPFCGLLFLIDQ